MCRWQQLTVSTAIILCGQPILLVLKKFTQYKNSLTPWWGTLGNVHSILHSKSFKDPILLPARQKAPTRWSVAYLKTANSPNHSQCKRIPPIWNSCTKPTVTRTPFQKTPSLSYVVQIRWKFQKYRNYSPVTVLAALEANLAKSQNDEQTQVPCDHPQPAEKFNKSIHQPSKQNTFLQQCAAIPYDFTNHEFPSQARGKHTCWEFESLIHLHKLWVGAQGPKIAYHQ